MPEPIEMYECDCCKRRNVPEKIKGTGYVCEDCQPDWYNWSSDPSIPSHHPVCPFADLIGPDGAS